jgi:hypothetical protein
MTDIIIENGQTGTYELQLQPGEPVTVFVRGIGATVYPSVHVTVHDAAAPVYARRGLTVHNRDPEAMIVPLNSWADMLLSDKRARALSVISAAPATVSIARA